MAKHMLIRLVEGGFGGVYTQTKVSTKKSELTAENTNPDALFEVPDTFEEHDWQRASSQEMQVVNDKDGLT